MLMELLKKKSKFTTSPFNQSHLSVRSVSDFVSLFRRLPAEVFRSQKYTQMDEGRKQREREDGEDRENCRTEGGNLKPNNDLQQERWRGGVVFCCCCFFFAWRRVNGQRAFFFFYRLEKMLNSLRAGMRSKTVCEKWEAKKTKRLVSQAWKVM